MQERMREIESQLLSSHEKRAELTGALNKYGAQAIIVAPQHSDAAVIDTGADFLLYVLQGARPLSATGFAALGEEARNTLGLERAVTHLFDGASAEGLGRDYRLEEHDENPIILIMKSIESCATAG